MGVLYGLTAGIGFTMYISLGVVGLMQDMFTAVDMPPGMSMGMVIYTDVGSIETLSLMVLSTPMKDVGRTKLMLQRLIVTLN